MIRHYGFLANRVRGKLLPLVYQLIQQTNLAIHSLTFSYANLNLILLPASYAVTLYN